MNLVDLSTTYCASDKNEDNSRFNILSAIISFATGIKAEKEDIDSVGIISPYAAQIRLIRAMMRDYYGSNSNKMSCATVHQFQGSESDVIIFDAVESYPSASAGWLMTKNDNRSLQRLINVAITRARGKFINIANGRFWDNVFSDKPNNEYYKLYKYMKQSSNVIKHADNKTLVPYIESINPHKGIFIYTDELQAINKFEEDMLKAKFKAVISIPDGELRESESRILDIISDARRRGVSILMKSKDYKNLPDKWKKLCVGADNSVFPLIIIDENVAWYGLPTSKMKFVDGNTSLISINQIMVRITGKHTIEMIQSLTDIESIDNGGTKRPLSQKDSNDTTTNNGFYKNSSLSDYISDNVTCIKCRSKMKLTRSRAGKYFLKCSNSSCDGMSYLEPELVNRYINTKNVTCPTSDHGELYSGVGKLGIYIKCEQGHFLNPDQI